MKIEKTSLIVLIVALLAVGIMGVTALTSGNNELLKQTSSIQVDDSKEVSDSQESTQLNSLAKITAEDAKRIAISAVDINTVGEITDIQIENENGNVVYAVEFTKNGVETDVKIDAGNGNVLKIENDNDESDVEDGSESKLKENEKGSDFEQDGIDHEFEGEEEHED